MPARYTVTYDITTPESVADGDIAETGFVGSYGIRYPNWTDEKPEPHSLRDALAILGGAFMEDCGTWFQVIDAHMDRWDGAAERLALHPPAGITPSSYRRLARLLGCAPNNRQLAFGFAA